MANESSWHLSSDVWLLLIFARWGASIVGLNGGVIFYEGLIDEIPLADFRCLADRDLLLVG